ncbi:regulator of sigma E protease [Desulfitispora alkaliphila]
MTTFWSAIFVFGLLIFVHELGHFLAAKRVGIKVEEFSIFMGPKLINKKVGETLYTLRLLPIGGYCKMAGMDGEEDTSGKGFNSKSVPQRMVVIAAGSVMNFLLAIVLFTLIYGFIGIPQHTTEIGNIVPDKPAAEAGLLKGDEIIAINDEKMENWSELVGTIQQYPGEEVKVTADRGGQTLEVFLTPEMDESQGMVLIGIERTEEVSRETQGLFSAIGAATSQTVQFTVLIVVSLGQMITGQMAPDVVGPVGIVEVIGQSASFGIPYLLNLAAIISINLGLLNLLPIPALDGSRLIFLAIEGIRRKPLDPAKENFVHLIGFAMLILLMILVTYQDVLRIFC